MPNAAGSDLQAAPSPSREASPVHVSDIVADVLAHMPSGETITVNRLSDTYLHLPGSKRPRSEQRTVASHKPSNWRHMKPAVSRFKKKARRGQAQSTLQAFLQAGTTRKQAVQSSTQPAAKPEETEPDSQVSPTVTRPRLSLTASDLVPGLRVRVRPGRTTRHSRARSGVVVTVNERRCVIQSTDDGLERTFMIATSMVPHRLRLLELPARPQNRGVFPEEAATANRQQQTTTKPEESGAVSQLADPRVKHKARFERELNPVLERVGMRIVNVYGDGSCFYSALVLQITGSIESAHELRVRVMQHMLAHPTRYAHAGAELGLTLPEYARRAEANTGVYAGEAEIAAAEEILDRRIDVFYASTLRSTRQPTAGGESNVPAGRRRSDGHAALRLLYLDGPGPGHFAAITTVTHEVVPQADLAHRGRAPDQACPPTEVQLATYLPPTSAILQHRLQIANTPSRTEEAGTNPEMLEQRGEVCTDGQASAIVTPDTDLPRRGRGSQGTNQETDKRERGQRQLRGDPSRTPDRRRSRRQQPVRVSAMGAMISALVASSCAASSAREEPGSTEILTPRRRRAKSRATARLRRVRRSMRIASKPEHKRT